MTYKPTLLLTLNFLIKFFLWLRTVCWLKESWAASSLSLNSKEISFKICFSLFVRSIFVFDLYFVESSNWLCGKCIVLYWFEWKKGLHKYRVQLQEKGYLEIDFFLNYFSLRLNVYDFYIILYLSFYSTIYFICLR